MIRIKTEKEIKIMSKGGKILADVLFQLLKKIKPNTSGLELDQLAEKLILEKGAEPAFKKVKNYNHVLCISINDVIVHGIPNDYKFKEEDVIGVDCGIFYKGFYTDMAETVLVGAEVAHENFRVRDAKKVSFLTSGARLASSHSENFAGLPRQQPLNKFLETGERALEEAIKISKVGNRIGHISQIIQTIIEKAGYSVVRSLVGHGVGKKLHEEPEVPGFLNVKMNNTPLLCEGMTLAIEVIYNMGKSDVVYADDGWTIKTKDGSVSGLFEKTIVVTKAGSEILTK